MISACKGLFCGLFSYTIDLSGWFCYNVNRAKYDMRRDIMGELSRLLNIGSTVEEQLNQVGIFTTEELKSTGAEQAWLKIQQIDSSACIHRLLALEGAIQGVKKTLLPDERKAELKEFYNKHKLKG